VAVGRLVGIRGIGDTLRTSLGEDFADPNAGKNRLPVLCPGRREEGWQGLLSPEGFKVNVKTTCIRQGDRVQ